MIKDRFSLHYKNRGYWPYASLFLLQIFISSPSCAINANEQRIGTTSQSVNIVMELSQAIRLQTGDAIFFKDSIQTKEESFAEFELEFHKNLSRGDLEPI